MLEYFVHLDTDDPPSDLVLAVAEVPGDVAMAQIEVNQLPGNWRAAAAPSELARLGDEFAERRARCLLWVPSVLAPRERNCLINPEHSDYAEISVLDLEPLRYDSRMFERRGKRKGK
jgi:RES domain-containing protein